MKVKGYKIVVNLSKIGDTKLEEPLSTTVGVPHAENQTEWLKLFSADKWDGDVMEKVSLDEALTAGLEVLARRQAVKKLRDEYLAAHPSVRRRGRGSEKTAVTVL